MSSGYMESQMQSYMEGSQMLLEDMTNKIESLENDLAIAMNALNDINTCEYPVYIVAEKALEAIK